MRNLRNLFHVSPEACFEDIEAALVGLRTSNDAMARRVDALAELYEQYLRVGLPLSTAAEMQNWIFDARMPNIYFNSVYDPEIYPEFYKIWVNGSGVLTTTLALARTRQYNFEIQVNDFVSEEAEQTFRLHVGGLECRWLTQSDRRYATVIPEAPEARTLEFAVTCSVEPGTSDVSFSFSTIRITAV